MPPSACTNLPTWRRWAPVNEPFSWPKSSDSMSSSGMAAQLTRTNGSRARSRQVVEAPRDQLLAGARLPRHQHRRARRAPPGRSPRAGAGWRSSRRAAAAAPRACVSWRARRPWATAPRTASSRSERSGGLVRKAAAPASRHSRAVNWSPVPGEHHHRHVEAALAQVLEETETVHARHLEVEEHRVCGLASRRSSAGKASLASITWNPAPPRMRLRTVRTPASSSTTSTRPCTGSG